MGEPESWRAMVLSVALLAHAGLAVAQETPGQNPPAPLPTPEVAAPPAPPANPPAAMSDQALTFTVKAFRFSGETVFDEATLAGLVREFVGRPVTLAELHRAADRITDFYAQHGYSLAAAFIPPQQLNGGEVHIEVLEGRIGTLSVSSRLYDGGRLQGSMWPVSPSGLYRAPDMEAALLRLNARPGLHVRALLSPGEELGLTNIVVQTAEQRFAAQGAVDNYGRKTLGETRVSLNGTANNPFGLSDQARALLLATNSGDLAYGYVDYSTPLSGLDLRARGSYGLAHYRLTGALEGLTGTSKVAGLDVDWTFSRERAHQWTASAGAQNFQSDTDFEGQPLPFAESFTMFQGGLTFLSTGAAVPAQVSLTAGSTFRHAHAGGQVNEVPLRAELDAQARMPFYPAWDAYWRLNGVYAGDPIPVSVQFTLGGPYSVRGYPPADRRGDSGWFATTGVRRVIDGGRVRWALRGFVDGGQVTQNRPLPGDSRTTGLASVGLGGDAAIALGGMPLSLQVDVSQPMTTNEDASDGANGVRVFAALSASY